MPFDLAVGSFEDNTRRGCSDTSLKQQTGVVIPGIGSFCNRNICRKCCCWVTFITDHHFVLLSFKLSCRITLSVKFVFFPLLKRTNLGDEWVVTVNGLAFRHHCLPNKFWRKQVTFISHILLALDWNLGISLTIPRIVVFMVLPARTPPVLDVMFYFTIVWRYNNKSWSSKHRTLMLSGNYFKKIAVYIAMLTCSLSSFIICKY